MDINFTCAELPRVKVGQTRNAKMEVFFSNHHGRETLHIGIQGEPVPQGRPRARRVPRSNRLVFWNPNRVHITSIRNAICDQLTELGIRDLPVFNQRKVKVTMDFHVERDNKDVDNMEKLVLDVLSTKLRQTCHEV